MGQQGHEQPLQHLFTYLGHLKYFINRWISQSLHRLEALQALRVAWERREGTWLPTSSIKYNGLGLERMRPLLKRQVWVPPGIGRWQAAHIYPDTMSLPGTGCAPFPGVRCPAPTHEEGLFGWR